MGYDHSLSFTAHIRKNVAVEQVQQALRPLFDTFGYPENILEDKHADRYNDHEFQFNPVDGELYVYTNGEVTDSFIDAVEEVASNLGEIVAHAGAIELNNFDTADLENARSECLFGPSAEAIETYRFETSVDKMKAVLTEFVGEEGAQALKSAANELRADNSVSAVLCLDKQEINTVMAALRYYQQQGMGEPDNRSDALHEIATDGEETSMDAAGIDSLCEKICLGAHRDQEVQQ